MTKGWTRKRCGFSWRSEAPKAEDSEETDVTDDEALLVLAVSAAGYLTAVDVTKFSMVKASTVSWLKFQLLKYDLSMVDGNI